MTYGVGIIGASRVSGGHAQAIAAVPSTELAAIAEPHAQRRKDFAEKHACTAYASHTDLLADPQVDIVIVGLPHFLHTEVTLAACAAGKHIFLEKPMAMTVADCDAVIAATEAAGVKLLVGHTEHFVPGGLEARRLVAEGRLGSVVFATDTWYRTFDLANRPPWFLNRAEGGGGMWYMNAVHMLDRLTWLIGSPITAVRAWVSNPMVGQNSDDTGLAWLDFANGAHATLHHTGYPQEGPERNEVEIVGTQANVRVQTRDDRLWLSSGTEYIEQTVPANESFTLELAALVRAIETDTTPQVDGLWGRYIVAVALACEESSRSGEVVHIPPHHYDGLTSW
jgi:predicted dehydrogenase